MIIGIDMDGKTYFSNDIIKNIDLDTFLSCNYLSMAIDDDISNIKTEIYKSGIKWQTRTSYEDFIKEVDYKDAMGIIDDCLNKIKML